MAWNIIESIKLKIKDFKIINFTFNSGNTVVNATPEYASETAKSAHDHLRKHPTGKKVELKPPEIKSVDCQPEGIHLRIGFTWTDLEDIPEGFEIICPYVPNPYALPDLSDMHWQALREIVRDADRGQRSECTISGPGSNFTRCKDRLEACGYVTVHVSYGRTGRLWHSLSPTELGRSHLKLKQQMQNDDTP